MSLLGHGDTRDHVLPKRVDALVDQRFVTVSAAPYHSLALAADGCVWSWGLGYYGKLGHGDLLDKSLPERIEALVGIVAISAGGFHNLALTADGAVWRWGRELARNVHGQNDFKTRLLPGKMEAFAERSVVSVTSGFFHSIAVTSDGSVWTWGLGGGRLGLGGDWESKCEPKRVEVRM